jgi:peptidyl-prolyl cis-trans isomerase B (cyclophilin B)
MINQSWILRAAVALAPAVAGMQAQAQLTPDRLYFGIHRPIPMQVALPEGKHGEAKIELYMMGEPQPVASAFVEKGGVDLASLFPALWSTTAPKVEYAQLVIGEEKVGPPVVLQPMVNPLAAMVYNEQLHQPLFIDPKTNKANFKPKEGQVVWVNNETTTYTGIRAYVDKNAIFDTSLGEIEFRLRPDQAPNTAFTFRQLVEGGFYTDIIFHRVVPKLPSGAPFVIQVGDPTGTGDGGPGFSIDLEPTKLQHDFGVLSMARENEPNTNGSQVFVCLSREGTQMLDGKYTSFAQAVRGAETILAIAATPLIPDKAGEEAKNRPKDPPVLKSARLIDAPPYGTGPAPVMRPPAPTKQR